MTTFVHIADERDSAAIRRNGLKLVRPDGAASPFGIFAMPVVPNFLVTHQWVRELKRRGFNVAVGIYFSIPDDQPVWAGVYNQEKQQMLAAEAAATLHRDGALGYEVIIPRAITGSEITAVRALPQKLGWRYFPGAHERGVFCGCEYCQRGAIKSRKIRQAYASQ
jgi:hypothetical protein